LLKDAATDVAIWGAAEIATTVMAACLPVLRVLLRQVTSSAQQYHSSFEPVSNLHVKGTRATTTVTAAENPLKSHAGKDDDTGSDKSILERSAGVGKQIVQTSEVIVEFHNQGRDRRNEDSDSMGHGAYEMGNRREAV